MFIFVIRVMRNLVIARSAEFGYTQFVHAVNAKLGHILVFVIPCRQIIEPVGIGDAHRCHHMRFATPGRTALAIYIVAAVCKLDLFSLAQRSMNVVNITKNAIAF